MRLIKLNFTTPLHLHSNGLESFKKTIIGRLLLRATFGNPFLKRILRGIFRILLGFIHSDSVLLNVVSLKFFCNQKNFSYISLLPAQTFTTSQPEIYPKDTSKTLSLSGLLLTVSETYTTSINNLIVRGDSSFVQYGKNLLINDWMNLASDSTSEELHCKLIFTKNYRKAKWIISNSTPTAIEAAGVFVDACAQNYAHWLTEVLPRIVLFVSNKTNDNIPLIINSNLSESIMRSIEIIVNSDRLVYLLPFGQSVVLNQAKLVSTVGYVPFGRRKMYPYEHSDGIFNPLALRILQDYILSNCASVNDYPLRKLYIRRNSDYRNISNAKEIENIAESAGYSIIEPESFSFDEQVMIFHNAKNIISATGAALANSIFCKPNTNIAVLIGMHQDMIYNYWNNLLSPIGINVSYVLGFHEKNFNRDIHSNYQINPRDFHELLKTWH